MAKKILVIDDEPHILKMVKSRLEANNYEVVVAFDGAGGLEKVASEKPDLIISDIMMPKMHGYEFVKKLKGDPVHKDIPVIMLSIKEKMKDLFELEGVSDFIVKPFTPEELLEKVRKYLKESPNA
jgi:CheY-like chemotaxis protein